MSRVGSASAIAASELSRPGRSGEVQSPGRSSDEGEGDENARQPPQIVVRSLREALAVGLAVHPGRSRPRPQSFVEERAREREEAGEALTSEARRAAQRGNMSDPALLQLFRYAVREDALRLDEKEASRGDGEERSAFAVEMESGRATVMDIEDDASSITSETPHEGSDGETLAGEATVATHLELVPVQGVRGPEETQWASFAEWFENEAGSQSRTSRKQAGGYVLGARHWEATEAEWASLESARRSGFATGLAPDASGRGPRIVNRGVGKPPVRSGSAEDANHISKGASFWGRISDCDVPSVGEAGSARHHSEAVSSGGARAPSAALATIPDSGARNELLDGPWERAVVLDSNDTGACVAARINSMFQVTDANGPVEYRQPVVHQAPMLEENPSDDEDLEIELPAKKKVNEKWFRPESKLSESDKKERALYPSAKPSHAQCTNEFMVGPGTARQSELLAQGRVRWPTKAGDSIVIALGGDGDDGEGAGADVKPLVHSTSIDTLDKLSISTGNFLLVEHLEEHPPLIQRPGMASRLRTYQVEKGGGGEEDGDGTAGVAQASSDIEVVTLDDNTDCPLLGGLHRFEKTVTRTSWENSLFIAPASKSLEAEAEGGQVDLEAEEEEGEFVDFVLVRSFRKDRRGVYRGVLRAAPAVLTLSQTEPVQEVFDPNKEGWDTFASDLIKIAVCWELTRGMALVKQMRAAFASLDVVAENFSSRVLTAAMQELGTVRGEQCTAENVDYAHKARSIALNQSADDICRLEGMLWGIERLNRLRIERRQMANPAQVQAFCFTVDRIAKAIKRSIQNVKDAACEELADDAVLYVKAGQAERKRILQLQRAARHVMRQHLVTPWTTTKTLCEARDTKAELDRDFGVQWASPLGPAGYGLVKKIQVKGRGVTQKKEKNTKVTENDADLRKIKEDKLDEILRQGGVSSSEIAKMKRWEKTREVTKLAAWNPKLRKYRREKKLKPEEKRHWYLASLAEVAEGTQGKLNRQQSFEVAENALEFDDELDADAKDQADDELLNDLLGDMDGTGSPGEPMYAAQGLGGGSAETDTDDMLIPAERRRFQRGELEDALCPPRPTDPSKALSALFTLTHGAAVTAETHIVRRVTVVVDAAGRPNDGTVEYLQKIQIPHFVAGRSRTNCTHSLTYTLPVPKHAAAPKYSAPKSRKRPPGKSARAPVSADRRSSKQPAKRRPRASAQSGARATQPRKTPPPSSLLRPATGPPASRNSASGHKAPPRAAAVTASRLVASAMGSAPARPAPLSAHRSSAEIGEDAAKDLGLDADLELDIDDSELGLGSLGEEEEEDLEL